jgi:hypothetical protein
MLKTEHLPRQARDKRNENSGKGYVFSGRVFNASSAEFNQHYRTKVQGEYQWAKFELAREKTSAPRKSTQQSKKKKKKKQQEEEEEEAQEEEVLEIVAPPDLEEEMQGMFGGAGDGEEGEEDEFEESYWNGTNRKGNMRA